MKVLKDLIAILLLPWIILITIVFPLVWLPIGFGLLAYVIIRGVYKVFTQDLGIPKDETITYYIPKDKRSFPDWMY